jgi:hypothetical protein
MGKFSFIFFQKNLKQLPDFYTWMMVQVGSQKYISMWEKIPCIVYKDIKKIPFIFYY